MKLHELTPAPGSRKAATRRGRGLGSGLGKTAGRGQKGQNSRSGGGVRTGFEGGQMPIQRRMPKYGFKNINHVEYKAINLSTLDALAQAKSLNKVDLEALKNAGLVSKNQLVKVLGNGSITVAVEVSAHAFSKTAEEAIVAAGGSVVKIGAPAPENA